MDKGQILMESAFDKADRAMHPAEEEWCFKTLTPHGFKCDDPPQQGFVRAYTFVHPDGTIIKYTTGARMNYWAIKKGKPCKGYLWKDLLNYLEEHYGSSSG